MHNVKNIKISIGIPTYNQGEFLEATILSALNQTIPPYEVVVSNNHSSDELTDIILKKYQDKIKVIKPEKFLSMVDNFNFLANNLSGDWVAFISSDDYYNNFFIESFYKVLEKNDNILNEIVLVRFGYNSVDKHGHINKLNYIRTTRKLERFPFNFFEQLTGSKGSICASLFRNDILNKINFFDSNLSLSFDWALFLNFSEFGFFLYEPIICSNIRLDYREGLSLKRLNADICDFIYIYKNIQNRIIIKNKLSFFWQNIAIKLRYYEVENLYRLYNLTNNEVLFDLKRLIHGHTIKSQKEYVLIKLLMKSFQLFYKI
jgi:glycosyltransferase involved in cell wall biosynthesis